MKMRFKKTFGSGYREFYMPTTRCGYKNKRNRKSCDFYDSETKFCSKIWTQCVGPNICNKYTSTKRTNREKIYVGLKIDIPNKGEAEIVCIDREICTLKIKVAYLEKLLSN